MALEKIRASDGDGALSENGAGTNYAFTPDGEGNVYVGDVATVVIEPPVGKQHADFTLLAGVGGVASSDVGLSLTDGDYATGDVGLYLGVFSHPTTVYVKALAECDVPCLISEYDGWEDATSASGGAGSTSAVSGVATEVEVVAGDSSSGSEAIGEATAVNETPIVEGSAGSGSAASGSATEVETVGGIGGSTSSTTGAVAEAAPVGGTAGSTSGASGSASLPANPVTYWATSASGLTTTYPADWEGISQVYVGGLTVKVRFGDGGTWSTPQTLGVIGEVYDVATTLSASITIPSGKPYVLFEAYSGASPVDQWMFGPQTGNIQGGAGTAYFTYKHWNDGEGSDGTYCCGGQTRTRIYSAG